MELGGGTRSPFRQKYTAVESFEAWDSLMHLEVQCRGYCCVTKGYLVGSPIAASGTADNRNGRR